MNNASLTLDGFPGFLRKGKDSDESCSESVRVEYDSRSSSHEDFDEYPQLKNEDIMKATARQRQLLQERSNARVTNIRVPDTYYEQIGSILKRSLYLRNEDKFEETGTERNCSPIGYVNAAADQYFLGRESSPSRSPRQVSRSPTSYEMRRNADSFLSTTTEDPPDQREDGLETKHAAKRDVLSEDTLDEIRSFVDQYNEQEQNTRVTSPSNNTEFYETENNISMYRTASKTKTEKHKRIVKQSLERRNHSLAESRRQSKSLRSTASNTNRKSDSSASLGQKNQKASLRNDSGFKLSEDDNAFQWEIQKKENKHKIRTSKDSEGFFRKNKHCSISRMVRSSDSDQTIVADRRSETSARETKAPDRKHVTRAGSRATSSHAEPSVHQRSTNQPLQRAREPRYLSSEDLSQTDADLGSADADLTGDRSASAVADKPARRRPTAKSHVPTHSLMRAEARSLKKEKSNADGGAFERWKAKKGRRAIAGGPTHSLLRAEARAKARGSLGCAEAAAAKGKRGVEKDGVPMLLWSVDTRTQTKKKKAAKTLRGAKDLSGGRGAGGGARLPELLDTRAAGDACRQSDSWSKAGDADADGSSGPRSPGPAPTRRARAPSHPQLTASKQPFR